MSAVSMKCRWNGWSANVKTCFNAVALGYAALKVGSECSFTTRKLRFLAAFCLA